MAETGERATTDIQVLGRFTVRRAGTEVDPGTFGGRLARRIVRLLATSRGTVVSRDRLTDALWPDRRPADPDANLNVLVSRARRALQDRTLIERHATGYVLVDDDRCTVDAERFLSAAAAGRAELAAEHPAAALHHLREALDVWGEPLPEDVDEAWARSVRSQLLVVHREALEDAAAAALAAREPAHAVAWAREALQADPLGEPAARLLVRALVACGDRATALATYDTFRRRLVEDLGIEPSTPTRDLHRMVLRDELPVIHPRAGPPPPPASAAPPRLAFVGRDRELGTVLPALSSPRRVVLLAGASGAGKSRLLGEVSRRSSRPVLTAAAYAADRARGLGFARSVLREAFSLDVEAAREVPRLARHALVPLVPELAPPGRPVDLDAGTRQSLRQEGAVRLFDVVGADGLVLLLDDLQWADPSSLDLLGTLLARVPSLSAVLAYRPEDVDAGHPVVDLQDRLRQGHDVVELTLGPLPDTALAQVVTDAALAEAIRTGTDRTPLAVSEVIGALAAHGLAWHDGRGWHRRGGVKNAELAAVVSTGQRHTIEVRVGRQPPDRRDLLALLGLLGRAAGAQLLARAADRAEPWVLGELDRLHRAGLTAMGPHGWEVAHDLIGETMVASLEPGHRADLHRRLSHALRSEAHDPAELATHLAGAGDAAGAASAYQEAARHRLDERANREARDLAETALRTVPDHADRSALLEIRAEARARTDDLAGARADLRTVVAGRPAGPGRATALARLALLESGADDLMRADELVELAITEAGHDRAARARALSVAAIIDMNLGREERGAQRADEAQALYEELGDGVGVTDILDGRAMATFLDGDIRRGVADFDRVARAFEAQGDLLRVVTPRSTRGHGLLFLGRADEAVGETERALDLARTLGHAEGVAYVQWHHSEALAAAGRITDARAAADEALTAAHRLDHRGWTATAQLAQGVAARAAGNQAAAATAFRQALELSAHLPLFASWAASRLGLLLVEASELDAAEQLARDLPSRAPALARFEGLVLQVGLAVARSSPDLDRTVWSAVAACEAGGHVVAADAIRSLARRGGT